MGEARNFKFGNFFASPISRMQNTRDEAWPGSEFFNFGTAL